jgi:hypothetical protein
VFSKLTWELEETFFTNMSMYKDFRGFPNECSFVMFRKQNTNKYVVIFMKLCESNIFYVGTMWQWPGYLEGDSLQ